MKKESSRQSRQELTEAILERYSTASKLEKARILDEFVAMTGYHRKHAARVLCSSDQSTLVERTAREQSLAVEALDAVCGRLPVSVIGFNSDNDSAFVNDTLLDYCQNENLNRTRSRPHQKDDQALVEQKNGVSSGGSSATTVSLASSPECCSASSILQSGSMRTTSRLPSICSIRQGRGPR